MQISMSKTREQFPLSTKKVLKKTILGTIGWVIILLFFYAILVVPIFFTQKSQISGYFGIITLGIFVLIFIIIAIVYLYQQWYYATYFYDLTADYIIIKKGPITPREITIPYERVQDVYVDQDLLDRIFGIYDVHLSSATFTSGMEAHIDGVERADADGLRALLLKSVSEHISKNRAAAAQPAAYAASAPQMPPAPPVPPAR